MRVLAHRGGAAIIDATRDDVAAGTVLEADDGRRFTVSRVWSYACALPVSPVGVVFSDGLPEVGAQLRLVPESR